MLRFFLFSLTLFVYISVSHAQQKAISRQLPTTPAIAGNILTISGSNTIGAKLAPSLAKRYLEHKGAKAVSISPGNDINEYLVKGIIADDLVYITVKAHGSSTGFRDLRSASTDIAISSRPINDAENMAFSPTNMRDFNAEHVIAIDGLAIVVNPNNPISKLSTEQAAKIFSGEISNWKTLSGTDRPITIYARDSNSGTWDTFKTLVLGDNYHLLDIASRFESNEEISTLVANDSGGIGFVGLASVQPAKVMSISDGSSRAMAPDTIFVATEDYPLSRRLFMYANTDKQLVREYLDFVQSDIGQQVVTNIGFVSQKPSSTAISDVEGPKAYRDLVQHGERLSINFRFNQGSAVLDNKAKRDIHRLALFLKGRQEHQNKGIQLIGFGDRAVTENRAVVLSKLRAATIKSALRKYDVDTLSVAGFGYNVPIASGSFKHKNSRVEVWLIEPEHLSDVKKIKKDIAAKRQPLQMVSEK